MRRQEPGHSSTVISLRSMQGMYLAATDSIISFCHRVVTLPLSTIAALFTATRDEFKHECNALPGRPQFQSLASDRNRRRRVEFCPKTAVRRPCRAVWAGGDRVTSQIPNRVLGW